MKKYASILTLGVSFMLTLSACQAPLSKGSAKVENENDSSETQIKIYSVPVTKKAARRTALNETNEALKFISDVREARYSVHDEILELALYNSNAEKISIPADFAKSSRFRDTENFLLISISDGDTIITAIIHKASNRVYISKGTKLREVLLNSQIRTGSIQHQGHTYDAIKLQVMNENGTVLDAAVAFINNSVQVIKI